MPWGSVKLIGPAGRDVYVNGNYADIAGQTNETFAVEYGLNTFESLDSEFRVDLRAHATVNDDAAHVEATLLDVAPPEDTPLTDIADAHEEGDP